MTIMYGVTQSIFAVFNSKQYIWFSISACKHLHLLELFSLFFGSSSISLQMGPLPEHRQCDSSQGRVKVSCRPGRNLVLSPPSHMTNHIIVTAHLNIKQSNNTLCCQFRKVQTSKFDIPVTRLLPHILPL